MVILQEDDGGRTVKVEVSLLVLRLPPGVQAPPPHAANSKLFVPEDLTRTSVGNWLMLPCKGLTIWKNWMTFHNRVMCG